MYSLIGITVILNALSPLVAFLHGDWRDKLLKAVGCAPKVDLSDMSLTIEEVNASISYPRRYALALIGPVFVFIAGIAIHFFTMRESASVWEFEALMDSTYWALITMTTSEMADDPTISARYLFWAALAPGAFRARPPAHLALA